MIRTKIPPGVKNLLIINGLFFLAKWAFANRFQINLDEYLGLYDPVSPKFRPWQIITHFFMHADETHIIFNMLYFFLFGPELEIYFGTKKFIQFYFITAIGAAGLYLAVNHVEISNVSSQFEMFQASPTPENYELFMARVKNYNSYSINDVSTTVDLLDAWTKDPDNAKLKSIALQHTTEYTDAILNRPMVGASGAVYGVLFAFGYLFPNVVIFIFPAWLVVFFMGASELYRSYRQDAGDNVAHFAHLGGMLFAWLLIRYWNANKRKHIF